MKRLTIEISDIQHQQIKMLAAYYGQSLKDFILARVADVEDETTYLTKSETNRTILDSSKNSDPKKRLKFNDIDELKNALRI